MEAAAYAQSRVEFTYQFGVNAAMQLMGHLQGAVALDFGAGTGASARALDSGLLRWLGASRI